MTRRIQGLDQDFHMRDDLTGDRGAQVFPAAPVIAQVVIGWQDGKDVAYLLPSLMGYLPKDFVQLAETGRNSKVQQVVRSLRAQVQSPNLQNGIPPGCDKGRLI